MAYIGNSPANVGNYQVVDNITTFNGTLTSFALTANSQAITPAKSGQLLVSLNGVLQEPDDTGTDGFKVSGSNIVFSSAPATGSTFWCVYQGQNVDIGTPSDGTVGTDQMSYPLANFTSTGIDDNATSTKFTVSDTGIDVTGTATTDNTILAAISDTSITGNAVDVFVYDTSKDSDGGAWRHHTQDTSWYNEASSSTRGSRKEFPAVAVIVAESNKVTIYDGDTPDLDMWMVWNSTSYGYLWSVTTAITALNGIIAMANGPQGHYAMELLKDSGYRMIQSSTSYFIQNIANRDISPGAYGLVDTVKELVNVNANDIAMTVLPNAPIDSATGLPVPTIAVATDGGVSVIKDDGSVVDSSDAAAYWSVDISKDNRLISGRSDANVRFFISAPLDTIISDGWAPYAFAYILDGSSIYYPSLLVGDTFAKVSKGNGFYARGGSKALTLWSLNGSDTDVVEDNQTKSSVAYITSDYNTGWMNGDIKLATLSDTDDTNVTGSELVTNGTFGSDTSGWSALSSATLSVDTNRLKMTNSGTTLGGAYQAISVTVGKTYTVHVGSHEYGTTNGKYFKIGNSTSGAEYLNTGNASSYTHTFTPTASTIYLTFQTNNNVSGATSFVDDISLRLAEEDRSVNGNGLQVFGTVTKSAVATGADLVAYSGWSSNNYLRQLYNDIDLNTSDYSIALWVKSAASTTGAYAFQIMNADNDKYIHFLPNHINSALFNSNKTSGAYINDGTQATVGVWTMYVLTRSGSTLSLYFNGKLDKSVEQVVDDVVDDTSTLTIGNRTDLSGPYNGEIALFRISATAPSAEQIKEIYEAEKPLFQENAKCTLNGSSDAVTALAYDDSTELLHVGTSGGRSTFQGLRRVDETSTSTTEISAQGGLIVEETA